MAADVGGFNEGLKHATGNFNDIVHTIQGIQIAIANALHSFVSGMEFFSHLFGGN